MRTQAEKTQEPQPKSAANQSAQKQSGGLAAVRFVDNRPEALAQRKLQAMAAQSASQGPLSEFNKTQAACAIQQKAAIVQRKGHKPRVGDTVRYPATGPAAGELYTVLASDDGGGLQLRKQSNNTTHNRNWQNDDIWIVYAADAKDIDRRQSGPAWDLLTKSQKTTIYDNAKNDALALIKASVKPGMLNATNRGNIDNHLTLRSFNKERKGEWKATWEEAGGRKWQFTIDMDKPEETSWQEPHVGWEVKLLQRGKNHADVPYENFAKEQGHIWLNDVPEARGL